MQRRGPFLEGVPQHLQPSRPELFGHHKQDDGDNDAAGLANYLRQRAALARKETRNKEEFEKAKNGSSEQEQRDDYGKKPPAQLRHWNARLLIRGHHITPSTAFLPQTEMAKLQ